MLIQPSCTSRCITLSRRLHLAHSPTSIESSQNTHRHCEYKLWQHVQLNSLTTSTANYNQCGLKTPTALPVVLPSLHCLASESKDKRLICHLSPSSRPNQSTTVSVCHCPNQTLNSLLDFNGTGAAQRPAQSMSLKWLRFSIGGSL